ncbi:unnamed protein product, partial [Timema podura]|nr:unnamed protein product [Timema podura]
MVNTILFQILGVGWSLVWWLTVKDSPRKDPNISPEELHHIEKCLTKDGASGPDETTIFLREVLASLPAWACVFASFAFSWNLASLLQQDALPPFSSEFGNHGKEDAITAILFTYTFAVLGMVIFGFANDFMSRKHSFITNLVHGSSHRRLRTTSRGRLYGSRETHDGTERLFLQVLAPAQRPPLG